MHHPLFHDYNNSGHPPEKKRRLTEDREWVKEILRKESPGFMVQWDLYSATEQTLIADRLKAELRKASNKDHIRHNIFTYEKISREFPEVLPSFIQYLNLTPPKIIVGPSPSSSSSIATSPSLSSSPSFIVPPSPSFSSSSFSSTPSSSFVVPSTPSFKIPPVPTVPYAHSPVYSENFLNTINTITPPPPLLPIPSLSSSSPFSSSSLSSYTLPDSSLLNDMAGEFIIASDPLIEKPSNVNNNTQTIYNMNNSNNFANTTNNNIRVNIYNNNINNLNNLNNINNNNNIINENFTSTTSMPTRVRVPPPVFPKNLNNNPPSSSSSSSSTSPSHSLTYGSSSSSSSSSSSYSSLVFNNNPATPPVDIAAEDPVSLGSAWKMLVEAISLRAGFSITRARWSLLGAYAKIYWYADKAVVTPIRVILKQDISDCPMCGHHTWKTHSYTHDAEHNNVVVRRRCTLLNCQHVGDTIWCNGCKEPTLMVPQQRCPVCEDLNV